MLKEIFLIHEGILLFHFNPSIESEDVEDDAILSSGLFSAINDFSKSARSDVLDSFSTENEFFLFMRFSDTEKTLVGVFERNTPENLARESLTKIHDIIKSSELPEEAGFVQLDTPKKRDLKITLNETIKQLFGSKEIASYIDELLGKRTDIPLAFLVDRNTSGLIAKFARPKPLFKEQYIREYFLLLTTINTTLNRLGMDECYSYFLIKSEDYTVASVCSGNIISITSGTIGSAAANVLDIALRICYLPSLETLIGESEKEEILSSLELSQDGKLTAIRGEPFPQTVGINLLTLINNINGFFKLITRRTFEEFDIVVTEKQKLAKLSLRRQKLNNEIFTIEKALLSG